MINFFKNKIKMLLVVLVITLAIGLRVLLGYLSVTNLPPTSDESISVLLAESIAEGEALPLLFTGQPYQFPVEAYLMSMYIEYFPHNAFGARFQLFVMGFIAVVGSLVIAFLVLEKQRRWPTVLLILIPSTYWLLYQAGYLVPQYSVSSVFAIIIFYLAVKLNRNLDRALTITFFSGIISGLSLSNHLLLLSVVIGAMSIIIYNGSRTITIYRFFAFSCGLLIGLLPMVWAIWTLPGAYDGVTVTAPFSVAFHRFYSSVLSFSLPGAMGINPPYFGDFPNRLNWGELPRNIFVYGFIVFILLTTIFRIKELASNVRTNSWLLFEWPDMFLIVLYLSTMLMAINARGAIGDHRYLLPAVWSFPFLVGYVYTWNSEKVRITISIMVATLVLFNLATSIAVLREWNEPDQIRKHADIPHLGEIETWMQEKGVKYCYATFWLAYRFNYETDGRITCSPIYNERFQGWPIPYKKLVDHEYNVAYVLSNGYGTKFSSGKLEQILQKYDIQFSRKTFNTCPICEPLYIYYDFTYPPSKGEETLSSGNFTIETSLDHADPNILIDLDSNLPWTPHIKQENGQYIRINFFNRQFVQRVDLVYSLDDPDIAEKIQVYGKIGSIWLPLTEDIPFKVERLRFERGHPIFGEHLQTIRFKPRWVKALRVEIVEPNANRPWGLSEIRVGVQTIN